MHRVRSITVMVLVIACIVGLGSCGESPSADRAPGVDASASSGDANPDAAVVKPRTWAEYVNAIMAQPYTSDAQKAVLQRAKDNGSLPASEYEKAWSDFQVCFTDLGHDPIPLENYNGIYEIPGFDVSNLTSEEADKFMEDLRSCQHRIMPITAVYDMQQGNPAMYQTMDEAVLDCMKRADRVDDAVTAMELAADRTSGNPVHFDPDDPVVRGCQVANGWHDGAGATEYKVTR